MATGEPPPPPPYDALVFSGGGAAAAVFIGAVRYLEHTGDLPGSARTFVGTSAGAIVALMCALGWGAAEMMEWVLRCLPQLAELDVEGVLELPARLGIDDGARLEAALRGALPAEWGGRATFLELAKRTGRHLVVCASNVTRAAPEYLSVETAPDLDVVCAVRMSTAIPIVYAPVLYRGDLYVDGALFENLPTGFVHSAALRAGRVLALNVALPFFQPPADEGGGGRPGLVEYLALLLRAAVVGANRGSAASQPAQQQPQQLTRVDIRPFRPDAHFCARTLRFEIDAGEIRAMADHGYRQVRARLGAGANVAAHEQQQQQQQA